MGSAGMDPIERRAIEEFGRRRDIGPEDAEREWANAGPAIKAGCRAAARAALRMDRPQQDRMVRSRDLTNRSE